jgi:hypothetical protein
MLTENFVPGIPARPIRPATAKISLSISMEVFKIQWIKLTFIVQHPLKAAITAYKKTFRLEGF